MDAGETAEQGQGLGQSQEQGSQQASQQGSQQAQPQPEQEPGMILEFRAVMAVVKRDELTVTFSVGFELTPEAFLLAYAVSRLQGVGQEPPVEPVPLLIPLVPPG